MSRFPAIFSRRFIAKMNASEPPKQRFSHRAWLQGGAVGSNDGFRLVKDSAGLVRGHRMREVVAFTWCDGLNWKYIPVKPVVRVKMGRA